MADTDAQTNIIVLNLKIQEARWNGKYCDVSLEVDGKTFKCHRLVLGSASEYFDTMFHSNFKESQAEQIALKEIKASAFEEVLQFIYAGNVIITESNLFDMIRASEFYKLNGLENLCLEYIQNNMSQPIENVFEIFEFIRTTRKPTLIDAFSEYIRGHFDYFSKTEDFLDITFEDLDTILMKSLPSRNQNVLLDVIFRWIQQPRHSAEDKDLYFGKLLAKIHFKNISPEYMEFVVRHYVRNRIVMDTQEKTDNTVPSAESSSDCIEVDDCKKFPMSLHVFINSSQSSETVTNVFTLQKHINGSNWVYSCTVEPSFEIVKTVHHESRLYCLTKKSSNSAPTFSIASSVSLFSNSSLQSPPFVLESQFDLCGGTGNSIYLYNKDMGFNVPRFGESATIDSDGLLRSIFSYVCDLDRWIILPRLKMKVANACMAYDNEKELVYLIGGHNPRDTTHVPVGFVQAYDHRTREWTVIPRSQGTYLNAACCFQAGKLYVSGGSVNPKVVEEYDPVAGAWRVISSLNNNKDCHRLISYENQLWAFGTSISVPNSNIEVCCQIRGKWLNVPSLGQALGDFKATRNKTLSWTNDVIVDTIVYKPFGL